MRQTRMLGATVAGIISVMVAVAARSLGPGAFRPAGSITVDLDSLWILGLLGVPIVAWLGWRFGPVASSGSRRDAIDRGLLMAVLAVVLGAFEAVAWGLLTELPGTRLSWELFVLLPYVLAAPIVGIVLFGPYVLLITVPAGLAWAMATRAAAAVLGMRDGNVPRSPPDDDPSAR